MHAPQYKQCSGYRDKTSCYHFAFLVYKFEKFKDYSGSINKIIKIFKGILGPFVSFICLGCVQYTLASH